MHEPALAAEVGLKVGCGQAVAEATYKRTAETADDASDCRADDAADYGLYWH